MNKNNNTKFIHTQYPKKDPYNSLHFPVYETAAFEFDTAESMADAFEGKVAEHTYSRITNPTVNYLEKRVAEITDAYSVTALNSGMAAISNTFLTLAYAGANIVTSPHLFGNSYSLFASTLKDFGVEVRFCDLTNLDEVAEMLDDNTCALYLEIITNPQMEVANIKHLSALAHSKQIPLVADTTIIPFSAFKAKDFGINIEIISSTKYISGGATSIGGLIIDYNHFDWSKNKRLVELSKQKDSSAFTVKLKKEIHRNIGAYMTPKAAQAQLLGLETLQLRYNQSANNCLQLAKELQKLPQIESVYYTGLKDNPFYKISKAQFGDLAGSMLTFSLESKESCFKFLNKLALIKRATNLFDNKSLIIHPASTIFGTFSAEVREKMHVRDKLIRLSVGLEDVSDILSDIKQALL